MGYLQEFPNVTVLGHIDAAYGTKTVSQVMDDVENLRCWREKFNYFGDNGSGPRGLDGVFIENVGESEREFRMVSMICHSIRNRRWRLGKPGMSVSPVSDGQDT
jgi:hypothetical protein